MADLGCGTSLSCVPFLRAGFTVIGVEPNAAMHASAVSGLATFRGFQALPNDSHLDFATLLLRVESASYMPQPGTPRHEPMVARLRELFQATAVDGVVTMPLITHVHVGRLAGD